VSDKRTPPAGWEYVGDGPEIRQIVPTRQGETNGHEGFTREEATKTEAGRIRGVILDTIASRVGQVADVHPRLLEGIEIAARRLARPDSPNDDRGALIALCERAAVPQEHWRNRDTAVAQRQVGEALMLLRAGCEFRILTGSPDGKHYNRGLVSNETTTWVEITHHGFDYFEGGDVDEDTFYIPTEARLDAADGKDWY
jgi:hypothetical protein